jgi:hypothetical protein
MSREETLQAIIDFPEIIEGSINMSEPNDVIVIFEGEYVLRHELGDFIVNGKITFNWLPRNGSQFSGLITINPKNLSQILQDRKTVKIIIDGLEFGEGHISDSEFGTSDTPSIISGMIVQCAVLGDRSISVEKLKFSILNLRDFHGHAVKRITETMISTLNNRLLFENDDYTITLDKCYDYKQRSNLLDKKGGYLIQYNGELISKKGQIQYEDLKDVFHSFSTFLTFLNGRRSSALFIQGIFDAQILWCDYSNYFVDIYTTVQSWSPPHSTKGLNEAWKKFYKIFKDTDDRNFLTTAIHWYVEANSNSGFTEGSIIMAQTALELIYNWWIVETKRLITGKDAENINASNKIRLLLSQLNIDYSVPASFTKLKEFVTDNKDIIDAPDAVVQIRNAIVHSQEEKRKKLSNIDYKAKSEALQLCLWYIEMAMLHILDFNEIYFNRCAGTIYSGQAQQIVPWKNK